MALIRKDRKLAVDRWQLLESPADGAAPVLPAAGDVIVPYQHWPTLRVSLLGRVTQLGISMSGGDDAGAIARDFDRIALIAIEFKSFTDGWNKFWKSRSSFRSSRRWGRQALRYERRCRRARH